MKPAWSALALLAFALASSEALAQQPPGIGITWGSGTGTQTWGPPPPQVGPSYGSSSGQSSDLEIGTLYVASAAYGVGAGVWIDAEFGVKENAIRFIPPAILGVGAPIGVYFLDHPPMPRGVPAAISSGMFIGAGEGMGIWSYQYVKSSASDQWGFTGMARSVFIGSTLGGIGGAAMGYLQAPSPKQSLFMSSAVLWGAGIGSMFGYGSTSKDKPYAEANDSASLGGLIGYNVGLLGAAGLSTVWVPTYRNIAFMWAGAGAGAAAGFIAFPFSPNRRYLVFQGTATTLGLAAGAVFTLDDPDDFAKTDPYGRPKQALASITGVGPMAVQGGMGAQVTGVLF